MRAWYGRGRYWFVVAASASASPAWGWSGYQARWEPLGREFLHWSDSDFADPIALSEVPAELIESLAETLDSVARARAADTVDSEREVPITLH
jgi:hypothetical protein